jgi:hypothetical protein
MLSVMFLFSSVGAADFGRLQTFAGIDPIVLWRSPAALGDGMTLALGGGSPQSARALAACTADPGARVLKRAYDTARITFSKDGTTRTASIVEVRIADGKYAGCQGWVLDQQIGP